jgi:hypothetical protein
MWRSLFFAAPLVLATSGCPLVYGPDTCYGLCPSYGFKAEHDRQMANVAALEEREKARRAAMKEPAAKPFGYAAVVEQDPKSNGRGCAPSNATVGSVYVHENGQRVTVRQVIGQTSTCPLGSRPLAVEF